LNKEIICVLTKIKSEGFEAYIVGGYVRDKLLGLNTTDIDIATNALPSELIKLFPNAKTDENYGSIKFSLKTYNFDLTTFRQEIYTKEKLEVNYINNIKEDALRRDFTINALYMDINGNIIDPLDGLNDLKNRTLKIIGNPNIRFEEDPLRILRTIRFKTNLKFEIEKNTEDAIINKQHLLKKVSYFRKKEELNKMFISQNKLDAFDLIKKYNLNSVLDISFDKIIFTTDPLGIWAQINYSFNYPLTKQEKTIIEKIRNYKELTNENLYKYGLYISLIASEILGIKKNIVNKKYKDLPIKDKKDIKINYKKLINLGYKDNEINDIIKSLETLILQDKLKNNKLSIIKYLKSRK